MKTKVYIIMIFALLSFNQSALSSEKERLDDIVDRIQKRYNGINDYHADFSQEAKVRALGRTQKSSGEVWLKKPDKMKWVFQNPTKEVYISDGNKMLYYNERDNRLLETTFTEINNNTDSIMLLSGLGEIRKLYKIKFVNDEGLHVKNTDLLELIPNRTSDDNKSKIFINVNRSNSLVDTIYLFDPFGNQTKISLSKVQTNINISDSVFAFKSPKGTEVINLPIKR